MSAELPLVSAIMARLADPTIHLAAYGGIVFPLSMIVEAPIIMLLSASTALSRDRHSFELLRRFMLWTGAGLTALHLLVALTPLYGFVVGSLIHAPEEIRGPARIGLIIMTPWTFSIAYRRLHQGVLIRFDRSHSVGIGTAVRLSGNILVLAIGYAIHTLPGIVVGASAVAFGVVSEAVYIGLVSRPIISKQLHASPPIEHALTFHKFLHFYIPLAMTPLLMLLTGPIGSAAVSRMPRALDSLAVWPVINGLGFAFRSIGIAFNEVVVALLDRPGAVPALRRFALALGVSTSCLLLLIAATPLAGLYFGRISALDAPLALLGRQGLWIILLMPAQAVLQSWFQGQILHSRKTRGITEAVGVYLAVNTLVLLAGIRHGGATGIYVALAGLVVGAIAQVAWLWLRTRAGHAVTVAAPET
jgi:hypothetical protein